MCQDARVFAMKRVLSVALVFPRPLALSAAQCRPCLVVVSAARPEAGSTLPPVHRWHRAGGGGGEGAVRWPLAQSAGARPFVLGAFLAARVPVALAMAVAAIADSAFPTQWPVPFDGASSGLAPFRVWRSVVISRARALRLHLPARLPLFTAPRDHSRPAHGRRRWAIAAGSQRQAGRRARRQRGFARPCQMRCS